MKKMLILFILSGFAISLPAYSNELSVKRIGKFDIYQGSFELTEDGFVSVSDRNVITYHVWDEKKNRFIETENTSQHVYPDLPEYRSYDDEENSYSIYVKNPKEGENPIVVRLVILPPLGQSHLRQGYNPNRDFYFEVLLNGEEKIFQSKKMNGVVKKFLGADMTKDSVEEIVLEYSRIGEGGFTMFLSVFRLKPKARK